MKPFLPPSPSDEDIAASDDAWTLALLSVQQCVASAGANFDDVLAAVVESALFVIPQAGGAVVEMKEGEELVYRAASGASAAATGLRLAIGSSLSGRCLRERRVLHCPDAGKDDRVDKEACLKLGVRSMIVVPLPHLGEMIGVLKIFSSHAHAFSSRDLLTAQLLAGPITMGLASARAADATAARDHAERRFAATFHQAAVGIAHVSPGGEFLLVNDRFCAIAGRGRNEIMGLTFQDITHPDDLASDLGLVRALLAGTLSDYDMEKRYIRADGRQVWVALNVSLVRDAAGEPEFFVAVIEDISARKQAEREAIHDPLTALLNRRGLNETLQRALDHADREKTSLLIALLDLDGFKEINDRFGHAEGDRCLQLVARALRQAAGPGEAVARLGGDEFVLVMPGATPCDEAAIADRIASAISAISATENWPLGASIGIAAPRRLSATPESLIAKADRAMYRLRSARRGRKPRAC